MRQILRANSNKTFFYIKNVFYTLIRKSIRIIRLIIRCLIRERIIDTYCLLVKIVITF